MPNLRSAKAQNPEAWEHTRLGTEPPGGSRRASARVDVVGRPPLVGAGKLGVQVNVCSGQLGRVVRRPIRRQLPRHVKVRQHCAAALVQQAIGWLHVAMHESDGVAGGQCLSHVTRHSQPRGAGPQRRGGVAAAHALEAGLEATSAHERVDKTYGGPLRVSGQTHELQHAGMAHV